MDTFHYVGTDLRATSTPTTDPTDHLPLPSQATLKKLFTYDEESGVFTNRVTRCNRAKAGDVAGSVNTSGYRYIEIDGIKYRAHRLAFKYVHGVDPSDQVDHINGRRDDQRISNLRDANHVENGRNRKLHKGNKSGTTGVIWRAHIGKWLAQIAVEGKQKHLGYYACLDDAIAVRKAAELEHSFHPNHGRQEVAWA